MNTAGHKVREAHDLAKDSPREGIGVKQEVFLASNQAKLEFFYS